MCGIVGIINGTPKYKPKLADIMLDMLWADQIRGMDGGGVFWYDNNDDTYQVVKNASLTKVLYDADFKKQRSFMEHTPFMIGHNRAATRGSVSSENNHPFDEGNVVLVHNGTMNYIPKEFDNGTKVDSHAIAKMLHKASPTDFMKKSFGAYALVWFNKLDKQLHLLRNKDRPLSLVYFEDFILVASEPGLGVWTGTRNGHKVVKVEDVKENHLYSFDPFKIAEPTIADLSELPTTYFKEEGDEYTYNYSRRRPLQEPLDYEKPTNVVPMMDWRGHGVTEQKTKMNLISPWKYFESFHGLKDKPANSPRDFSLKRGEVVTFTIDTAKSHDSFALFLGYIPGIPSGSYCVKGNAGASVDKLVSSPNMWRGVITEIHGKNNKFTIWVKDVTETAIHNPDFTGAEVLQKK